jgi:hypothetical protein
MVVPVRQVSQVAESDFRSSFAVRAAERRFVRLASGGQPRRSRKTTEGELLQANRGDDAEEGISDRVKPSPSREAVEAVSILRSSRKLSCEGKRDPAGDGMSEVKS